MKIPTPLRYFLCIALGYLCLNRGTCQETSTATNGISDVTNSLFSQLIKLSDEKAIIGLCTGKKKCNLKIPNTQCLSYFCICSPGYKFDGLKCHNGRRLEEICETKQQCQDNDANSVCVEEEYKLSLRICKCKYGYAQINNQCFKGATIGSACLNTHQCEVVDPESICFDLKACLCRGGFFFDGIKCRRIAYFNQRCNTTGECQASDQKTHCSFEPGKTTWPTCTCIPGHIFNAAERHCVSVPAEWERLSKVVGILLGLAFLGSGCFLCARRNRTDPELGHCERGNSHEPNPQFCRSSNRYRRSSRCARASHSSFHNADVPRYQYNVNANPSASTRNTDSNQSAAEPSSSVDKPPPYEDVIKDRGQNDCNSNKDLPNYEQAVQIYLDVRGQPSSTVVLANNHNTGEGTSHACNTCVTDSNTKPNSNPRPQSV